MYKPRVKICCIKNTQEAWTAINHGASVLGLVSHMPSGPGKSRTYREILINLSSPIELHEIAEITKNCPPGISTFLLTSCTTSSEIGKQIQQCNPTTVQICDYVTENVWKELKSKFPYVPLVQVVHVTDADQIPYAKLASKFVDGKTNFFLLETKKRKKK